MKIAIPLINVDPEYRGGLHSYIHGLLGGLVKEDSVNDYYLFIGKGNEKYYKRYLGKNFHIITFSYKLGASYIINKLILTIFTAPVLRNFHFFVKSILFRKLTKEVNDFIDMEGIDIVYATSVPIFPMKVRVKLIVSPHDIQQLRFPQYFSLLDRWSRTTNFSMTFARADVIQASSSFMRNDFIRYMKVPKNKIVLIPGGIRNNYWQFKPNKRKNRIFLSRFLLKSGYLFYPAQHWPHKNHITLLKAIMYIKKRYFLDLKVVFSGEINPKFSYLYDFVKSNCLEKNVYFLGNVEFNDVLYAYNNAGIVVMPSEYESASLPVREAMAMGKPVIASRMVQMRK